MDHNPAPHETGWSVRQRIRRGEWTRPTQGMAPGYVQANLAILPRDLAAVLDLPVPFVAQQLAADRESDREADRRGDGQAEQAAERAEHHQAPDGDPGRRERAEELRGGPLVEAPFRPLHAGEGHGRRG